MKPARAVTNRKSPSVCHTENKAAKKESSRALSAHEIVTVVVDEEETEALS